MDERKVCARFEKWNDIKDRFDIPLAKLSTRIVSEGDSRVSNVYLSTLTVMPRAGFEHPVRSTSDKPDARRES